MPLSKQVNALRGAVIDRVRLNPFSGTGGHGRAYDPTIFLKDGRQLRFVTQEAGHDYGTLIVIVPARASSAGERG